MNSQHMRASIATYNGVEFFPLAPRYEDIYLQDIAHSLAMSCRYNGHSRYFYSVAQHCVQVGEWLLTHGGPIPVHRRVLARWGLLHDASEAYIPDVCSPIKPFFPTLKTVESQLLVAIAQRFNMPWPIPDVVKYADRAVFKSEIDSGIMRSCKWWKLGEDHPDAHMEIDPWGPEVAYEAYVKAFEDLFGEEELARTYRPGPS
jgi:hypothetical protein